MALLSESGARRLIAQNGDGRLRATDLRLVQCSRQ